MNNLSHHHNINYVEFPASDMGATKDFFGTVFGWEFEDYGPEYMAILSAGLDGGFYQSDLKSNQAAGAALVVIYSDNLTQTQTAVKAGGGKIIREIFAFPGGRRFHFTDPSGNEFAVWSE